MTTLYVDNIAPNLQSKISAPNLQLPSGSVIQVVEASTYTITTTTGTSFVDSNIEATITPSSTSNKILVWASTTVGKNANTYLAFRFTRNGTSLGYLGDLLQFTSDSSWSATQASFMQIDSPNSTSALTYKLQFANEGNAGTAYTQVDASGDSERGRGQIILMEIAG